MVGIDHARRIFEAARHPKSFVSLDRADHLLLADPQDALYVGRVIAAWAARYVQRSEEKRRQQPPHGEVWVESGPSGLTTSVRARSHRMLADEPLELGGADAGATPYEYLLAGLGACTAMTLRLYADRKGWPLEGVRVRLEHARVHAVDCEECSEKEGMLDRVDRAIRVEGPLDSDQRHRLFEIANRCPVHRTLTSAVHVISELEGEEAEPSL